MKCKRKIKVPNIAYMSRWVSGIWFQRALKYGRLYLQQETCLHAGININRFSCVYLIIILSDMTKIHTFLKENTNIFSRSKTSQLALKFKLDFRRYKASKLHNTFSDRQMAS
jgi:hypothetical protein